jgi:hypothetical protein
VIEMTPLLTNHAVYDGIRGKNYKDEFKKNNKMLFKE